MQKLELIELLEKLFEKTVNYKKQKNVNNYEVQENNKKLAYRFIINNNRYQ